MVAVNNDLRQSAGWAKYLKSQGWEVEELKVKNSKCKIFIRKIPLIGSAIKIQRPEELPPLGEIDRIAKKHRALFVKLEPSTADQYNLVVKNGFVPDPSPSLATKTIVVDLTKSEVQLWSDLSQDARQSVRKAQSSKLKFQSYKPADPGFEIALQDFHRLLKETGRRQKFWTPSLAQLQEKTAAFGEEMTLLLVFSPAGRPVAGAFILAHDGTHSASTKEGQHLFASYFLLWETIRYLRKHKQVTRHDLAGIYDPRFHQATRSWQGLTIFKRKFGGTEIEYPRPLIKYYHPSLKLIYKIARLVV